MRVVVIANRFPAISETFVLNQVTGLLERGHDVRIVSLQQLGSERQHPDVAKQRLMERVVFAQALSTKRWENRATSIMIGCRAVLRDVRLARAFLRPRFWLRHGVTASLRLADCLSRIGDVDIVHAHFGPIGLAMAKLRLEDVMPCPLVVTFHGSDINARQAKCSSVEYYRPVFQAADRITVGTQFMAEQVAAIAPTGARAPVILPMGVDVRKFPHADRGWGAGEEVRLLAVGRLVPVKGTRYAIEMLALLKNRHPGLRLCVVGDGPLRRELEDLALNLGVQDRIEFCGALLADEVRKKYTEAHIFVMPGIVAADGTREGQGVVIAEAQACGLPVVASRVGGIPYAVDEGRSAILVPPGNAEALASAVESLLADPDRCVEMGRAGRAFVQANYDNEVLNDQLVRLYESVISDVSAPRCA